MELCLCQNSIFSLLSPFNLLLSLPVVQLHLPSPHSLPHLLTDLPHFSNRSLEINSALVWPETLAELNMNDWDCSNTCCWEREREMHDGSWGYGPFFCFFVFVCFPSLPPANSRAILCCSLSSLDGWATLLRCRWVRSAVEFAKYCWRFAILMLALNEGTSPMVWSVTANGIADVTGMRQLTEESSGHTHPSARHSRGIWIWKSSLVISTLHLTLSSWSVGNLCFSRLSFFFFGSAARRNHFVNVQMQISKLLFSPFH